MAKRISAAGRREHTFTFFFWLTVLCGGHTRPDRNTTPSDVSTRNTHAVGFIHKHTHTHTHKRPHRWRAYRHKPDVVVVVVSSGGSCGDNAWHQRTTDFRECASHGRSPPHSRGTQLQSCALYATVFGRINEYT